MEIYGDGLVDFELGKASYFFKAVLNRDEIAFFSSRLQHRDKKVGYNGEKFNKPVKSSEKKNTGFVYVLEVKDIDLRICKIGMTTRTPYQRCAEINKSSTGDFIWAVAHYIVVDSCQKFESLVHTKLAPLRQKGREFFNLTAEDGFKAMLSILENQEEIKRNEKKEDLAADVQPQPMTKKKKKRGSAFSSPLDSDYLHLIQLFSSLLKVDGRTFWQRNQPMIGVSDGTIGVQRNFAINRETGFMRVGINLEGSGKSGGWKIASFLLNRPRIEALKSKVENPDQMVIRFVRDAWQAASRLEIKKKFLGGGELPLSEMDEETWDALLDEALTCLDENRDYRGRKKNQTVTLESDGRELIRDISPHLTIWSELHLEEEAEQNLRNKLDEMYPVYEWMQGACVG